VNKNDSLKQKIIEELSNETENGVIVRSIFKEEPHPGLDDAFTSSVVRAAKATKKTSPVIRLTRVALPFATCAAAVLIFLSVGLKDNDNSPLTKDFDSARIEEDAVIANDIQDPSGEEFDILPTYDEAEKVPASTDATIDDQTKENEVSDIPTSAGAGSQKEQPNNTQSDGKAYGMSIENAINTVTAFSSAHGSTEASNEIVIKISEEYYSKAIFGYTVYLSADNEKYEVIVTSEQEISKNELLSQISKYTESLCTLMNNAENTDKWRIEIISENLPATVKPNTVIKVTRVE
jgi:hypothetical protein